MAKSKYQCMNEYRTRKKDQLGKRWMKMERERVNGYFRPNEMLADDEKEKRRDKNRRAAHTFYRTHKTDKNNNADFGDVNENPNTIEPVASGSKESDDYELSTTNELSLTVTLIFIIIPVEVSVKGAGWSGGKKRVSHALQRSYKTISER